MCSSDLPWLINVILTLFAQIRNIGGSFYYYSRKGKFFTDFIARNALLDLGFIGVDYTWCNVQSVLARHWDRLDRCLAN